MRTLKSNTLGVIFSVRNAVYAKGFEAVCGFVSSDFSAKVIDVLADNGVKIILLRCAGFNNVDIKRAKERGEF